jgi:hypothetical protein
MSVLPVGGRAYALVVDDIRSDADWILASRFSDGAIANYIDRQAVWPYLSNFAAMGLARATEVTKDTRYVSAAWVWADWYKAHMDQQGFVTDYVVRDGKLISTGFMDSTDSYAATFLMALRDTYRANKNLVRLRGFKTAVVAAIGAIEATQTSDGLTWTKPTWHVKYVMDQAEVYAGLLAGSELASTLGDPKLVSRASRDAERVRLGVATLWNQTPVAYDWAVHGDGARVPTDWSRLYPDAMQQAWAVAFGLVADTRARQLMSLFVLVQPKWANPQAIATLSDGLQAEVGYWPVAALALQRMRNPAATTGALSIRSGASAAKRAWPYTTGIAGQLILLQAVTLPGARTFDAKTLTPSQLGTRSVSIPRSAPVSSARPAATRPTGGPAVARPSPTPSPTPLARIGQQAGPAGAEVTVDPDRVTVTLTTPSPEPSP